MKFESHDSNLYNQIYKRLIILIKIPHLTMYNMVSWNDLSENTASNEESTCPATVQIDKLRKKVRYPQSMESKTNTKQTTTKKKGEIPMIMKKTKELIGDPFISNQNEFSTCCFPYAKASFNPLTSIFYLTFNSSYFFLVFIFAIRI